MSRTPDRKRGRANMRGFALLAATIALFLQIFVVQTHTHVQPPLGVLGYERTQDVHTADDGHNHTHVSVVHEQSGCFVCAAFSASGRALLPDVAALIFAHSAAYETAALAIRRAPRALTHSWQSRAPPIAL